MGPRRRCGRGEEPRPQAPFSVLRGAIVVRRGPVPARPAGGVLLRATVLGGDAAGVGGDPFRRAGGKPQSLGEAMPALTTVACAGRKALRASTARSAWRSWANASKAFRTITVTTAAASTGEPVATASTPQRPAARRAAA